MGSMALVPSDVTTRTSTVPLPGTGGVARMIESLLTVKLGAGVAPKSTCVAPLKPQPMMRIGTLLNCWLGWFGAPIVGPWFGVSALTRGGTAWATGVYVTVPG